MEIQYQNNTTGVFHFDWVIYFYFLSPFSDVAMQKYLLSLILVFQIKHSLAVCTYKVSYLKLVKIVFSSEFVIFFREIVPLSSLTGPQGTSAPIGRQDSFTRLAMSHRRHDVLLANQAVLASQQRSHYHWSVRLRQLSSAMFASFKKLFFILQQSRGDIYLFEMWRPLAASQSFGSLLLTSWHVLMITYKTTLKTKMM